MTTMPQGGIHYAVRARRRGQDLGEQNGLMKRLSIAGGHGQAGKRNAPRPGDGVRY